MGVAIASDVPLLRSLIQMAIQDAGFNVIGEVGSISDLLDFCEENEVAIAILDLHLGEGEFLHTIEKKASYHYHLRLISSISLCTTTV